MCRRLCLSAGSMTIGMHVETKYQKLTLGFSLGFRTRTTATSTLAMKTVVRDGAWRVRRQTVQSLE